MDAFVHQNRIEKKAIWTEVIVLWLIALGVIFVFEMLSFIPFVQENLAGAAGLVFILLPIEWLYRKKIDPATYGISRRNFSGGLVWALGFSLISFPFYIFAYQWWFGVTEFDFSALGLAFRGDHPLGDLRKEILGHFLLVALPEEVFYRGYMQSRLNSVFKKKHKILGAEVGWSLLVTSAFFAVGHLVQFRWDRLGTFFPGLVFGWLRERNGSIGGAIVFHALCNIWARIMFYGYA